MKKLNNIRNDREHLFSFETTSSIRAAISEVFPVAASLFRTLNEDPLASLGDAWSNMLETKELYDQELKSAQMTLAAVAWFSPSIAGTAFQCTHCQSELVEQKNCENEDQLSVELLCKTCGTELDVGEIIEATLEAVFGNEAYDRAKDTGEGGPVFECPSCQLQTLVENEGVCANCNESFDYTAECIRCSEHIPIQDYLDGLDGGLCSYCQHITDKVMRDD